MAWYLNNATGADSRVNIPSVIIGATVGDYIEFKCVANAGNVSNIYVLAGLVSGTTNSVRVEPTRIFLTAANSSTAFTAGYVQPAVGDIFTLRLTKSSATTWNATLNGSLLSTNTFSNNLTLTAFGNRNSSLTDAFRGGYYYVAISTNGGASATRYYDPSASGGTGTILPDTINSANNGTQAGTWPSDDSEWVFYSSGATYQLTAQGGTFSYSGSSAALNRGYKLAAQGATYTYTGASANLSYNTATVYRMDALGASYSYAGASSSLLRGFKLSASGGAYSYAGSDAALRRGFKLSASGGAFNYSGADASLTYVSGPTVYRLTALGATYVYSGGVATLTGIGVAPAANPNAFINAARVGGTASNSAKIGSLLSNSARIDGIFNNKGRLSQ